MIKKVGRYVIRTKKPKMVDDVCFTPNITNLPALQEFQEFCKTNGIIMVVQCLNISKENEPKLREILQKNDVISEEDAL